MKTSSLIKLWTFRVITLIISVVAIYLLVRFKNTPLPGPLSLGCCLFELFGIVALANLTISLFMPKKFMKLWEYHGLWSLLLASHDE